jgi:hypothetical protein
LGGIEKGLFVGGNARNMDGNNHRQTVGMRRRISAHPLSILKFHKREISIVKELITDAGSVYTYRFSVGA